MLKRRYNTGNSPEPKKAKIDSIPLPENRENCLDLCFAAASGDLEKIKTLLNDKVNIESVDGIGKTALATAAFHGNLEVVKTLIQANANIDSRNDFQRTPLHFATYSHVKIVQAFIDANANIDVTDCEGKTPLHYAIRGRQLEIVQALINANANIEPIDLDGLTSLHYAAAIGNLTIVEILVNAGANIAAENNNHETPLMVALERGHHDIARFLRERGAVLPTRLMGKREDDVNLSESVHTTSVDVGVSKAIQALQKYYLGELNPDKITKKLAQASTALSQFVAALPYDEKQDDITNKNGAAKRGLAELVNIDFIDSCSKVTLKEALSLFWLALTDHAQVRIHERKLGLLKKDSQLNEDELKAQYAERQENATKILTECFYQIIRGENLNQRDAVTRELKDDGETDNPTCPSGSFNKLVYGLNHIHSLVDIPYVTKATITKKAKKCVNEIFDKLPLAEQKEYAKNWAGMPDELIKPVGDELARLLQAEFDEFQCDDFNAHKIIGEILASLEWMTPKGIEKFLAKSEEENEAEYVRRPRP